MLGVLYMSQLLTVQDVAKRLGLSHQRIRALIYEGRLPAEKVGNMWVLHGDDLETVNLVDKRSLLASPPPPGTVTIPDTSKALGVTRQRVHELIRRGRLKVVHGQESRRVYVTEESLRQLVEEREHATGRCTPRPFGAPIPKQ